MAETAPQSNNVRLKFRGKPTMERNPQVPATSKLQAKAMFAAANGKSTLGIPKKVGEEFTEDLGPGDVKKLPKRKSTAADKLRTAGRISDKAMAALNAKG